MHIGQKIKERAEKLGITPTSLGKRIGLHRASIHELYNRGHIRTDVLENLCRELDYNFFEDLSNSVDEVNMSLLEPTANYQVQSNLSKYPSNRNRAGNKVGFTFFIDVDDIDDFKKDFKEFLRSSECGLEK